MPVRQAGIGPHNGWWNNNWGANSHYYGRYGNFYGYGSVVGIRPLWRIGIHGGTATFIRIPIRYYPYYAYDASMYGYRRSAACLRVTAEQPYPYNVAPTAATRSSPPRRSSPANRPVAKGSSLPNQAWRRFTRGIIARRYGLPAMRRSTCRATLGCTNCMSLALFSLQDYRGAAMEAHAAVALGPISDWAQLYSYYGDLDAYTKPLDALVEYVRKNPASAEGRFLLAYHDLMMGHNPEGKEQLAMAIELAPQDKVAQQLMLQLGGTLGHHGRAAPAARLQIADAIAQALRRAAQTAAARTSGGGNTSTSCKRSLPSRTPPTGGPTKNLCDPLTPPRREARY